MRQELRFCIGDAVYIYSAGIHQYELLWEHYTGNPTAGSTTEWRRQDEVICTVLAMRRDIRVLRSESRRE